MKAEILTKIWEISQGVNELTWPKAISIGLTTGITWEFIRGAIDGLHMGAGIAAFWAVVFTGVAKLFSTALKNYLEKRYPKLFKESKQKDSGK